MGSPQWLSGVPVNSSENASLDISLTSVLSKTG